MAARRLPAPWTAEKISGGYVVRDANGQALACAYCRATEAGATRAKAPGPGSETRLPARRPRAAVRGTPNLIDEGGARTQWRDFAKSSPIARPTGASWAGFGRGRLRRPASLDRALFGRLSRQRRHRTAPGRRAPCSRGSRLRLAGRAERGKAIGRRGRARQRASWGRQ